MNAKPENQCQTIQMGGEIELQPISSANFFCLFCSPHELFTYRILNPAWTWFVNTNPTINENPEWYRSRNLAPPSASRFCIHKQSSVYRDYICGVSAFCFLPIMQVDSHLKSLFSAAWKRPFRDNSSLWNPTAEKDTGVSITRPNHTNTRPAPALFNPAAKPTSGTKWKWILCSLSL